MARNALSRFCPPSTPRSMHATRSPSSRSRRSCTDAWGAPARGVFGLGRRRAVNGRPAHQRLRRRPRGQSHHPGLPLAEAYALARAASNLVLGGIAIAERHVAKEDEHHRMLAKQDHGCRFFITQSVYDAGSTKSLLSDYALSLRTSGRSPVPVVLTFSPCGSVRTLEFMKWLGISFPRWLENELRHSADTLERSVDLCERVFTDVQDYAREKRLPIGINVESVSIPKVGDRRVGGAISAIELTSRTVRRCSAKALQQTRLAQRNEVRCNDSRTAYRIARSINLWIFTGLNEANRSRRASMSVSASTNPRCSARMNRSSTARSNKASKGS